VRLVALVGAALAAVVATAVADDRGRLRPDVDVLVPLPPYPPNRLEWFDGRLHHVVPGAVSIDGEPYVCDVDGKRFKDGDSFAIHLVSVHHVPAERIPERILLRDGIVHFVSD
jgi:hypothetical protein